MVGSAQPYFKRGSAVDKVIEADFFRSAWIRLSTTITLLKYNHLSSSPECVGSASMLPQKHLTRLRIKPFSVG
jgi:hypothetical protein